MLIGYWEVYFSSNVGYHSHQMPQSLVWREFRRQSIGPSGETAAYDTDYLGSLSTSRSTRECNITGIKQRKRFTSSHGHSKSLIHLLMTMKRENGRNEGASGIRNDKSMWGTIYRVKEIFTIHITYHKRYLGGWAVKFGRALVHNKLDSFWIIPSTEYKPSHTYLKRIT